MEGCLSFNANVILGNIANSPYCEIGQVITKKDIDSYCECIEDIISGYKFFNVTEREIKLCVEKFNMFYEMNNNGEVIIIAKAKNRTFNIPYPPTIAKKLTNTADVMWMSRICTKFSLMSSTDARLFVLSLVSNFQKKDNECSKKSLKKLLETIKKLTILDVKCLKSRINEEGIKEKIDNHVEKIRQIQEILLNFENPKELQDEQLQTINNQSDFKYQKVMSDSIN